MEKEKTKNSIPSVIRKSKKIAEQTAAKADEQYNKLPLDDISRKLGGRFDLRTPKFKVGAAIIFLIIVTVILSLFLSGETVPNESKVREMITQHEEASGMSKVRKITFKKVEQIDATRYAAVVTVDNHVKITYGSMAGQESYGQVMYKMFIEYSGDLVEIKFEERTILNE